ncbi:MAG: hypothetical protein IAF02_28840 [Anaerolineae bacterium]|nr:hypothetical protein [Anaerolineae bacterium]
MEFESEKGFNSTDTKGRIEGLLILYPMIIGSVYLMTSSIHANPHEFSGRRIRLLTEIVLLVPPWFWVALITVVMILDISRLIVIYKRRKREESARKNNEIDESEEE